ncbi:hypothetical protein Acid345_2640 [Candidatus Koribacter versatilis Ellin345]|uniref:Dienelactone hydrolase domain-containing protein n=1 Tax=Koribacter versatilis (strain Ellin345) TaxID=204669 RepID=Q1INA9_KORVE|nr:hypothetical protein [Candidatus Koribacter versatilis]ABF41641.1 hypothetical protein Acid345_2640 [Candidatus Koribacter versatilis Ellin345]
MRRFLAAFLLTAAVSFAQNFANNLPHGTVIERVECKADPSSSYAAYLPSNFTPEKKWPIVFAFDPGGRGAMPIKLYKDTAEKYGFIFVASNDSRNFSAADSDRGTRAMWLDTHDRFPIDENRVYTTGFSGGARMAGHVALACTGCKIAGVIAHGAGYPVSIRPTDKNGPAYFLMVGDVDFNWQEVIKIRQQREDQGYAYRVETFHGPHQWGPPELFEAAMRWMQLKAMQQNRMPREQAFIDLFYKGEELRAVEAQQQHDTLALLAAYRSLVSDFEGLKDNADYAKKLAALKSSKDLKEALKKENEQITQQAEATTDADTALAKLGAASSPSDRNTAISDATAAMKTLKDQVERTKSGTKSLVLQRAFAEVFANTIERGQAQLENKKYDNAEMYFTLIATVSDEPWPQLLLADARAEQGNRKGSLQALDKCIKSGLKNPKALETDAHLQSLRADPEFQRLVASLQNSGQK